MLNDEETVRITAIKVIATIIIIVLTDSINKSNTSSTKYINRV